MLKRVDEKGRLVIPKDVRERLGLTAGKKVRVRVAGKSLVIEAVESVANEYLGKFKIVSWPKDLDEFTVPVMRKWKSKGM